MPVGPRDGGVCDSMHGLPQSPTLGALLTGRDHPHMLPASDFLGPQRRPLLDRDCSER
jgi:hypothetical protein